MKIQKSSINILNNKWFDNSVKLNWTTYLFDIIDITIKYT